MRKPICLMFLLTAVNSFAVADDPLTFKGHRGAIRDLAIFPDGKRAVSTGWNEHRVWDTTTGEVGLSGRRGSAVAVSRDGSRLAIGGTGELTIHDGEKYEELQSFDPHDPWDGKTFTLRPRILAMVFSKDHRLLATSGIEPRVGGPHGYPGGVVKIWETASGKLIHSFPKQSTVPRSLAFSPDSKTLAAGSLGAGGELPEPGVLRVWDIGSGKRLVSVPMEKRYAILSLFYRADGRHVVTVNSHGLLSDFKVASGKLAKTLKLVGWKRGAAAFSPDGQLLASVGYDGIARVFDVTTGKPREKFPAQPVGIRFIKKLRFSHDGQWLAATGGRPDHPAVAKAWKIKQE